MNKKYQKASHKKNGIMNHVNLSNSQNYENITYNTTGWLACKMFSIITKCNNV